MPRTAQPTRRRILDSAYELFYRKGFSRVGVDEIAAFAGVTSDLFTIISRARTSCWPQCSIFIENWLSLASENMSIAIPATRTRCWLCCSPS